MFTIWKKLSSISVLRAVLLIIVLMAAFNQNLNVQAATTATIWQRWETSLTSQVSYSNPYKDVTLSVTYTGPGGQTLNTYGFWDGGSAFKIRAAFSQTGTWQWVTTCSDTANSGLHNKSGTVTVSAYSGTNSIYTHGFLKVHSGKRYLVFNDGTPFLWTGDTAWVAPLKATLSDWQTYINDRATKKFSVVQISPASSWGGTADTNGNTPFTGSGITQWNPPYWQGYEQKVQYANDNGLVVLANGLMEPVSRYPSSADAQIFARNLVARLYGNAVIFSPSFDSPYMTLGDDVGNAVNGATSVHLITQHTGTSLDAAVSYYDKSYLDFCGYQSGHQSGNTTNVYKYAREWGYTLYSRNPYKPVINLEAFYDSNGTYTGTEAKYKGTAADVRRAAYGSWLSGALGYTYGAHGIWNWEPDPAKAYYWNNAKNYPSSTQMKHLHDFFAGINWYELRPDSSLIKNQGSTELTKMVLAKNSAGNLGVAYLPDNSSIIVNMGGFSTAMQARWFNPVNGTYTSISSYIVNSGDYTFSRPSTGDWVLLLQAASTTPTPTPTPSGALITDLVVNDTANAGDWSIRANLQTGDQQYGDRTYLFSSVPANVSGCNWIRTANDSKAYTSDPLVTFKVTQNADVLVAHNDLITTKPSWMSGWTDTGDNLTNNETTPRVFSLFKKYYPVNSTVSLGNNGSTAEGLYTVVVKPASTTSTPTPTSTATPTPTPTPTPAATPSNLVGFWKLDDGTGTTAVDSSGNGYSGTLYNGAAWSTGKYNGALSFDGTDDYVNLGNPSGLQITGAMTLSAWVYIDTFTNNGRIIAKQGNSSNRGWTLNVEGTGCGSFQIASNASTAVIVNSGALTAGQWVHLAGVYEPGTALRIYVNGVLNNSNTTAIPSSQYNNSLNVNIGRRPDNSCYFDGKIDEVRVYNRALSASEISAIAQ